MIVDKRMLQKELKETKISLRNAIEANIKLADERNWAIDDKNRALRRIERTLDLINGKEKPNKEGLIKALTDDFYDE